MTLCLLLKMRKSEMNMFFGFHKPYLIADCDVNTRIGTNSAALVIYSDKYLRQLGKSDLFTEVAAKNAENHFFKLL